MAAYTFSRDVQEYLKRPESNFKQLLHKLLNEKREQAINPMLNPTPEDVNAIFSKVAAIGNYCIESSNTVEGILYINITLGGIRANVMINNTRADVCQDILTCYRQYWMNTRGLDPAPFIPLLTPKALQLAVPISTQGYRTLAEIQAAQLSVKKKVLRDQEQAETHKAEALKRFYHF